MVPLKRSRNNLPPAPYVKGQIGPKAANNGKASVITALHTKATKPSTEPPIPNATNIFIYPPLKCFFMRRC